MVQKMFIHINQKMIPIDTLLMYSKKMSTDYLYKLAIYDYYFFVVMFDPTFVFFIGHVVLLAKILAPPGTWDDLPGNCWQLRNIQGQKRLEEARFR